MDNKTLHLLILEDSPDDAELAVKELEREGFTVEWSRVDTENAFREALSKEHDLILVDYVVPSFSGTGALKMQQEIAPDIPLIVVSGKIGEEVAVECMKSGATDYVLKDRLFRLGPAVKRALEEAEEHRARKRAEKHIRRLNSLLKAIRHVNQLVVMEKDRDILLQKACDALIEARGYDGAWLGFLRDEKTFATVKGSGFREDVSHFIEHIMGGDHPPCIKNALAQKHRLMVVDKSKVCGDCFYKNAHTGKEAAIIHVEHADRFFGLLAILFAPDAYADEEEKGLLKEVASDIAFALHNMELEEERNQAEEEKKKVEAQLRQAQKMEAIGTLAGGIAHDFNNILSLIIGYTELAIHDLPEDSRAQDNMNKVFKASERAKDLVKQILAFSRYAEQEQKPVQIHLIVKEALKLLRPTLPTTIEIRQNIAFTGTVMADPTQMHQVIMNLSTNAYHAMREKGGVLEVSLADVELDSDFTARHLDTQPGPYLKLTVSDTGHGIKKKDIDRIFDPYYTTKEKTGGTGMGLAVVHGIVKGHGGAITVYSEPGKGSTFNVFLPRIESAEAVAKPEKMIPLPMGKERILFVDDEPFIVDIGKGMLEHLGYTVVTKTSPIEALEAFKAQPDKFDLVITDMTMPKMTGDELAKKLMRIRPDLPIILCTGFSELIDEQKAKAMGIRRLIMKPIVQRDMAKAVRQALDQPSTF